MNEIISSEHYQNRHTPRMVIYHPLINYGLTVPHAASCFTPSYHSQEIEAAENKERLIKEYHERLQSKINQKNCKKYVEAFLK